MTRIFRTAGLGLIALAASALIVLPAREVRSQGDKPSPLEGAWKQVEQKNGDAQEYQKFPEGMEMIDLVTGGRFVWTVVSKDGTSPWRAGSTRSRGQVLREHRVRLRPGRPGVVRGQHVRLHLQGRRQHLAQGRHHPGQWPGLQDRREVGAVQMTGT